MNSIELILCDIDGCLSQDVGYPYDLQGLAELRQRIHGQGLPFSLCTGRQSSYVEALCQVLDLKRPCICEHGCTLFDPLTRQVTLNEGLTAPWRDFMADLHSQLARLQGGLGFTIEPGKAVCISLHPLPGPEPLLDRVLDLERRIVPQLPQDKLNIGHSPCCIEIVPRIMDKAQGARDLCHRLGLTLDRALAIGDSQPDIGLLQACGFSGAPANALAETAQAAAFLASKPQIWGVLEILDHYWKA